MALPSTYIDDDMYHRVEHRNKNFKFFWNKAEGHWVCLVERLGEYYDLDNKWDLRYFFNDEVD